MFSIFNVSGSAISAQSQRLNVVASNLANVDAVAGPDGQAYKARQVVFQTTPMGADSPSAKTTRPAGAPTSPATPRPTPKAMSRTPTSMRSRKWST